MPTTAKRYATEVHELRMLGATHSEITEAVVKGDRRGHPFRGNQWTDRGPSTKTLLGMLMKRGGFTFDWNGRQPKRGYAVGVAQAKSLVLDAKAGNKALRKAIDRWRSANADQLSQSGTYIGGWHDEADGKAVFDIVRVIPSKDGAIDLATKLDEKAIFDLASMETIDVGGSGGYSKADSTIYMFEADTPTDVIIDKLFGAREEADDVAKVEISKIDEEQQLVFGWAYVISEDGQGQVVDKSGDVIELDSDDMHQLEKAAYQYVIDSRKGGDWHKRTEDNLPVHVSDMVESMFFTPEKIAKMGLPETTPVGWWAGFKVNNDEVWQGVKDGKYTSFSIHGTGVRAKVDD